MLTAGRSQRRVFTLEARIEVLSRIWDYLVFFENPKWIARLDGLDNQAVGFEIRCVCRPVGLLFTYIPPGKVYGAPLTQNTGTNDFSVTNLIVG